MRIGFWVAVLAGVVVGAGCGPLSPPRTDAGGSGGGGATGGGATGGGAAIDGGAGGGAAAPFTFGSLSLSAAGTLLGRVNAIHGGAGQVWAVTDYGKVLVNSGSGFSEVPGFASGALVGVYVAPDGAVFLAFAGALARCTAGCTTPANHQVDPLGAGETITSICGRSATDVYAVGERDTPRVGVLYRYTGTSWTKINDNLGVNYPKKCWFDENGQLFVGARQDLLRYDPSGGAGYVEPVDLTALGGQAPGQHWYAVGGFQSTVFAVGDGLRISQRGAGGQWTLVQNPNATATWFTVAGLSADEAYAGGSRNGAGQTLSRWNGAQWSPSARQPPSLTQVHALYFASPTELYLGGTDDNGPVIVKGTR